MQNFSKYGNPPYSVVLVHGGPGAAGSMEAVAKKISGKFGVIEAKQTRYSIESLLVELRGIVSLFGHQPVTLIGHSWGAWLSILFVSKYPDQVKKLILVAAAPLEEKFASKIMEIRLERLDDKDREALYRLMNQINIAPQNQKDLIFLDIAAFMRKTDAFQPECISYGKETLNYRMYESVWAEAETMRSSGELLRHARKINCQVLAIHGDYDPHPYNGVKIPMEKYAKNFRFCLLENCGHEPWNEISAKKSFYDILEKEI